MREYSFVIADALRNGLRPDSRMPRNAAFMTEMQNLKPTDFGAVSPETVTYPITDGTAAIETWPHPQLFQSRKYVWRFDSTGFLAYDPDDFSTPVGIVSGNVREATDDTSAATISTANPWHFANWGGLWAATSGDHIVLGFPKDQYYLVDTNTTADSVCMVGDTMVFAGIGGTYFQNTGDFDDLFDTWYRTHAEHWRMWEKSQQRGDTAWLFWGNPVYIDEPFYLLRCALNLCSSAEFTAVKPQILDAIEKGDIGLAPLPLHQPVKRVLPLGQYLAVYGESEIWLVDLENYGMERVLSIGINYAMAAGGTQHEHVFLDTQGQLWRWPANQSPQRLGYSEYVGGMSEPIVTFDPEYGEYWIADDGVCYVLTPRGLGGSMDFQPTSLIRDAGEGLIGTGNGLGASSWTAQVTSDTLDLAERGTKHFTEIQCFFQNMTGVQALARYRYNSTDAYANTAWTPANKEGVAFPIASFTDGQIRVKGTVGASNNGQLERLEVRWNGEDKRYRRGTKGTPESR